MSKIVADARSALAGVLHDGAVIAVGGFGLCGVPFDLIEAVRESGASDLTVVSNNMGIDGHGLGLLIEAGQVTKVIASYVGENRLFAQQVLSGALSVEFSPQGTLAERLRAGGAGIPAFYTASGVGTPIADGKHHEVLGGRTYIREHGIVADLSLARAHRVDRAGNATYRATARNFNPLVAAAGRFSVIEAEMIEDGYLAPDEVVTPGIFVDRVVPARTRTKPIEHLTTRPAAPTDGRN